MKGETTWAVAAYPLLPGAMSSLCRIVGTLPAFVFSAAAFCAITGIDPATPAAVFASAFGVCACSALGVVFDEVVTGSVRVERRGIVVHAGGRARRIRFSSMLYVSHRIPDEDSQFYRVVVRLAGGESVELRTRSAFDDDGGRTEVVEPDRDPVGLALATAIQEAGAIVRRDGYA